jgi:4-amino-4-deoxy-L-arabinose transferase-like glycosyltransferase
MGVGQEMVASFSNLDRVRAGRRIVELPAPAKPLLRPVPRSAMFFPLAVLIAVLPGLYALRNWDLTPPGPWWGLRGIEVYDGHVWDQAAASGIGTGAEARVYRAVALQPPLYVWVEAIGFSLSRSGNPLVSVLPSYLAGALVVVLVYLHGRIWRGQATGLVAAILMGFNRDLLIQMQQATPATLGLAGMLIALLAYAEFLQSEARATNRWPWVLLGSAGLGMSLLSVGGLGLVVIPVVLLHQMFLAPESTFAKSTNSEARRRRGWLGRRGLWASALVLCLSFMIAGPWHISMFRRYEFALLHALAAPPYAGGGPRTAMLSRLLILAPATLPLCLYGAARAVRRALVADPDDWENSGNVFWLSWLVVAALIPALWPSGPRHTMGLFLLVAISLLAARVMTELANRRIPARVLAWLAPATACSAAWWLSTDLREAIDDLLHLRRPDAATALGLHIALDLFVVLMVCTRRLDIWAQKRDDRRRLILGVFLLGVVVMTVGTGLREVRFRHRETSDLLSLRDVILRRQVLSPFSVLAVVGPDPAPAGSDSSPPGGRLRFLLRATLPNLKQVDLAKTEELTGLPDGQCLVILAGTEQRLTYAMQSRLNLEAIHPGRSGVLDAFATARTVQRLSRR